MLIGGRGAPGNGAGRSSEIGGGFTLDDAAAVGGRAIGAAVACAAASRASIVSSADGAVGAAGRKTDSDAAGRGDDEAGSGSLAAGALPVPADGAPTAGAVGAAALAGRGVLGCTGGAPARSFEPL
jgi:hypothetical protein